MYKKKKRVRSIVWVMPKPDFAAVVAKSKTYTDITRAVGAYPHGRTNSIIKKRMAVEGVDGSHLIGSAYGRAQINHLLRTIPLEEILVEHSTYSRSALKQRLLKRGI